MPNTHSAKFLRERMPSNEHEIIVKSTCKKCGESITEDIRELAAKENDHALACELTLSVVKKAPVQLQGQAKVLIIEDYHLDIRECLNLFNTIGVQDLRVATGAEQAMDYLQTIVEDGAEAPRLVVLDLLLGSTSGFEVLRYIKKTPQLAAIPVIVWSRVETENEKQMCKMMGVNAFVPKAAGGMALLHAVSQLRPPDATIQ